MESGMRILTTKDFNRLSHFIQAGYGIKMPESKKTMLQARLQKRLRNLGFDNFTEYCDFVLASDNINDEVINMIDEVTTNKTDFFREPSHFTYLTNTALPETITVKKLHTNKRINIWSAGCSSGEEPYTIAMVVESFFSGNNEQNYAILATDLSTQVLDKARLAIYEENKVAPVPMEFKRKYLLKSKEKVDSRVRIVPELRSRITFARLNFMDDSFPIKDTMDIIFCRNVIIYFDRETQEKIVNKLVTHLRPDGFLFMGHSETLFGLNIPVTQVAPTVYKKI